jgi:hypothetical protein
VTIGQQIVETRAPQCPRMLQNNLQVSQNKQLYGQTGDSWPDARLAIYAGLEVRYEKNCKSARMMSLAGGEF